MGSTSGTLILPPFPGKSEVPFKNQLKKIMENCFDENCNWLSSTSWVLTACIKQRQNQNKQHNYHKQNHITIFLKKTAENIFFEWVTFLLCPNTLFVKKWTFIEITNNGLLDFLELKIYIAGISVP